RSGRPCSARTRATCRARRTRRRSRVSGCGSRGPREAVRRAAAVQWKLSEEQTAYQKTFRGWLADVAPSQAVRGWVDAGDGSAFASRFAADGWAGVGLPEELGGQGGGLVELALTAEELGRAAVPSADWLATVLAAPAQAGPAGTTALLIPAEGVPDE